MPTRQEASDLEQIIGAALVHLVNREKGARQIVRKAKSGGASRHWIAVNEADLAAVSRLIPVARRFEREAHDRALAAAREEARLSREMEMVDA